MALYTLKRTQKVPITVDEAWEFLSNPRNLTEMTPKDMKFTVLTEIDKPLYAGQIFQYSVSPLPGMKTKWVSEITQVKAKEYFIDVQLEGPYAFWHHQHFIYKIKGGVIMEDIIHYKVPLGWIGQLLHPIIVLPKLKKIFEFRQQKIRDMFGELE